MDVPDLRTLTAEQVLAMPLSDLGVAALADWARHLPSSGIQWLKVLQKRMGKSDELRKALLEALHWASNEGYLARDLNTVSDSHYFVTRLGRQTLGLPD